MCSNEVRRGTRAVPRAVLNRRGWAGLCAAAGTFGWDESSLSPIFPQCLLPSPERARTNRLTANNQTHTREMAWIPAARISIPCPHFPSLCCRAGNRASPNPCRYLALIRSPGRHHDADHRRHQFPQRCGRHGGWRLVRRRNHQPRWDPTYMQVPSHLDTRTAGRDDHQQRLSCVYFLSRDYATRSSSQACFAWLTSRAACHLRRTRSPPTDRFLMLFCRFRRLPSCD